MQKILSVSISRILCAGLLGACISVSPAVADSKSDMAALESIQGLADRDNARALGQLQELKARLGGDADYALRIEVLRTQIALLYDAGQIKPAEAANAELLALARAHNDKEMTAFAQVMEAFELQEQGKHAQAIVRLNEIEKSLAGSRNPVVLVRLLVAYGAIYQSLGNYEKALENFQKAMQLSDELPRRKVHAKLYRMEAVASLYWTMHNPEKALETAEEALKLAPEINSPKMISSLSMIQGIALAELGRYPEALGSFNRILQIARSASMPLTEATALGNIADLHLRTHNYVEAERVSREVAKRSEELGDKGGAATANANIGFALGGQGKIHQAMGYINAAIKFYKDSDAKSDVESLLGETAAMYEAAHMYKEALATVREQQKLSDELFRSDRAKAVATLQEQFNAAQRQKQIELLARDNKLKDADLHNRRLQEIILALGALVTVMVGIFIYSLYRRVRATNEKLREVNLQLEFHAVRDPLTGLYNRRSFVDLMKTRTAQAENERRDTSGDNPDCLILMDIDHFKQINDTWGHAVGDSVLMEVAHRLKKTVRDSDMVLRWGGEEFLVFSPKSNPAQITSMVDRVLRSIGEQAMQVGELQIPVTVTAGFISLPFSGVPEEVCGWEKTLQIADMALYLGKANGRNRAYGLARLLVPHEQAMPILDHDLSAAIGAGMVELIEVLGPEQKKNHTSSH